LTATTRTWLLLLAGVLVGSALGAAAAWVVQERRISELEQRALRADALSSQVDALTAAAEESDRLVEQLTERLNQPGSAPTSPTATHGTGDATSLDPVTKQFAYVTRLSAGSKPSLVADYAQFLTGDAAAKAAAKDNAESPPPSDYYIVNDSGTLRTLPVAKDAKVTLITRPGEGAVEGGYASNLKTLAGYLNSDTEETAGLRADGFWLTLEKGVVVALEEQYVP